VEALRGVDIAFDRGSFTAIMGPSGSGKSTLLHILAGLDQPTDGWVEIDGVRLDELDDRALTLLRRRAVGFIFQAYNLLPVLTAEGNITLPLRIGGRKPDPEWLTQLIDAVGLAERRFHRPAEMSGGQQQRVAVARALITRPAVVFGDEPTGNLDSISSREVLELMRRVVDELGQTIVMVTHDPIAASYADRVVFLADGAIVDELLDPDTDAIIDKMKSLGA
jgi:putative ABC transport system ATP-binding protein